MRHAIFFFLFFIATGLYAQMLPTVQTPQLPTINVPQIPGLNQNRSNNPQVNPFNTIDHDAINQRNQQIINEALEYQRQVAARKNPQTDIEMLAANGFPSQSSKEGTGNFYESFVEINNMLLGKQPLSLGRAVFLVENSYYGNTLKYSDFQNTLKEKVWLCSQKIKEDKLDANNDMVKNMMLFRLVSDTLKVKPTGTEKAVTNYPIKYDLDDYKSEANYDSHFVTKLMKSGKGQCYSMPLYYLVLAEQIGANASLSFSPRHSFIKIQDEKGAWYNLELTCNAILSDAHYMNNSYIKAEAIRNRIYLEPLNKKEVVAGMLLELARGYYDKYGLDDFYLKCVDTALLYSKKDINALIMKAVYEERLTLTLAKLLEAPKPEIMKEKSPRAYLHYEKMQALYKQIDGMGYEELPAAIYSKWLEYLDEQKEKSRKDNTVRINGLR